MRAVLETNDNVPKDRNKFLFASLPFVALVCVVWSGYGVIAVDAQEPAGAPTPQAGPQVTPGGRGAGAGRGRGSRPPVVDTLGTGPWNLKSELGGVHVTVVTKGLDHPWGMAFLPDGDVLVTERPGRLRVVRKGVLDPMPIGPLPEIRSAVLGGLMDVVLHPNFARNRLIYFVYSKPGPEEPAKATTAVARARWDGGSTLTDVKDIFVAEPWFGGRDAPKGCCGQGPSDASFGARMVFDKAGFLYVTLGDRNYGEKSQDPSWDWGKIVRLRDDGSIPQDNPFVGKAGYRREIYTLGHRNPLGLAIHPVTGEMWSTEFGPRGGDELNLIGKGGNYGWITTTHGTHYDGTPGGNPQPGMEEPVLFWVPSINPGNLAFYYGDKFPAWKGNMLMAALTHCVLRITFDEKGKPTGQEKMLTELGQRLRDLRIGPDGYIYLLTDETFGAMLRMEPAAGN